MTPYYEDSAVTIYHGDCREISLPSSDLVLTDPPYGIAYNRNDKHRGSVLNPTVQGDDLPFDPSFLLDFPRLILWGANCYASRLPDSKTWLCWRKTLTDGNESQSTDFELAWTNCVGRSRYFEHLWAGCYRASESGDYLHTTQKPLELMRWCLGLVPRAKTILDPFMGSGTTLRAAKDLGRKATGIEIEERYCEIAARRMAQEVFSFA